MKTNPEKLRQVIEAIKSGIEDPVAWCLENNITTKKRGAEGYVRQAKQMLVGKDGGDPEKHVEVDSAKITYKLLTDVGTLHKLVVVGGSANQVIFKHG